MKRSLTIAALGIGAMMCAPAALQAGSIKNGSAVDLTVGGQVNRALLYVDDGTDNDYRHIDSENNSTRFFFDATGKVNEDVTAGAKMILLMSSNNSAAVSATTDDVSPTLSEHTMEVFFSSNKFGKLTLGQGSTVSDGSAEVDLSGTSLASYSYTPDIGGAYAFTQNGTRSSVTIATVSENFDGLGRGDRIRYDSPTFGGFSVGASHGSQGTGDVGLTYSGSISGVEVAGAIAYYNMSGSSGTFSDGVTGSISALMANGLNLTFAAGQRQIDTSGREDPIFYYAKLGYKAKLNSLGSTNFSVDYSMTNDLAQNDDEHSTFGVQAVQEIAGTGSALYFGYRNHSLERTSTDYDDIHTVLAGAFVAF